MHACSVTSVVSNSLRPYGLQSAKILCPWDFPSKSTGSQLPFRPPGYLPNPGMKPTSLMSPALAGRFFTTIATWEAPNACKFKKLGSLKNQEVRGCSPWGHQSWTQLSDFTFTFHFHALEKEMATHSSVLAWRIPGTGKPGGLPSIGSHRVGHD